MLFTNDKIFNSINTIICPIQLHLEKSIKLDNNITYMSIVDNYIYCRIWNNDYESQHYEDLTSRINIINPLDIQLDNNFKIKKAIASHNMYFFKDKNNIVKAIGGQHSGIGSMEIFKNNLSFIDYHNLNPFIYGSNYHITMAGCNKIYDPNIPCPYYANGLHLFEFNEVIEDKLTCLNNNLPIISGIHPGRYDGHYGYTDNKYIENCRNGLTVYDSLGSIIYNDEKELYFLYHRANIGTGRRTIQYSTSPDLINWSEYNLVNFGDNYNYFNSNIYISNFFKLGDCYMAILPYIKRINNAYNSMDNKQYNVLFYSYDCIHYHIIGPILINNDITCIEEVVMATNKPYIHNNKMYFYFVNTKNKSMNIYSSKLDRFCYISNKSDSECTFQIKLTKFNKNKLVINLQVSDMGYVLIQLHDKDNNILTGYEFDSFDKISIVDSLDYVVSWNNNSVIPYDDIIISFKLYNARLYNIN